MLDLRIQIVNYRTKQYLIDCIVSIREELEQADFSYSFAILDNASGDDLSDIPERFPWLKNTEIIQGDKNLGFGAGHNALAKRGDAKYLLILNPDLKFIEPGTIGRLLRAIKETGSQVVGPRLITTEGVTQAWDHGGWRGILYYWKSVIGIRETVVETKNRQVPWVSGAVFLIDKISFETVSGFDEEFFLYAEELDLCDRVRMNGNTITYAPSISVMHYGGVAANRNDWILGSTVRLYKNRVLRFLNISR
ncbi:MAG: glycosyltransferase family 2 protein [Candidatus Moranbacteria bacterium]|nr:glycosyltransferase family 2 protein [Candidatus Moranbacteria bacterium]